METKKGINESERYMSMEYIPIESPIVTLIKYLKNKKQKKTKKEIENLELQIKKTKLEKELKRM